jgi:hypothetical protein
MKFKIALLLILGCSGLKSQTDNFGQNSTGTIDQVRILESLPEILDNDIIFYGFIHGAAMPQKIEAQILKELMDKGINYYAPEVSYSGAYFLNKFLDSGNVDFLKYVLGHYAAQQDASIEWIEKYKEIYNYKKENNLELIVIGTDFERNDNLISSHLANILDQRKTGNEFVDSLSLFESPQPDIDIWSGKPLYKISNKYGYSNNEILYNPNSQHNYTSRFIEYYLENKKLVLEAFNIDSTEVEYLLDNHLLVNSGREEFIKNNFSKIVIPLIAAGEKIYSNFGYAHILQAKLNDKLYLAGLLKETHPNLKIYSILTQMADCEVLENKKYCKEGIIRKFGKKIRLASICGSITSHKLDGDTKKEKVLGIEELRTKTNRGQITVIPISTISQEKLNKRYFLDYVSGKNSDNLKFEPNKSTLDYIQALIFVKGSNANTTYEMY